MDSNASLKHQLVITHVFMQNSISDMDGDETNALRRCILAMQETLCNTDDPDISLISDAFQQTFEIRRDYVKTHTTTEILSEYPALQLHSCVRSHSHESYRFNSAIINKYRFSYWQIFICKRIYLFKLYCFINFVQYQSQSYV
jgi:hypothetical protein